ncbi:MAG: YicC/YloC family endoribonuclease [Acidiferrobacterales bacterium]|nr:YicC family protein [Gammaproteobacteria bacterium]
MTFSMTAFARRDADCPWGSLAWELRSVNHRYLEVMCRLPEELRSLEPQVRSLVGGRLARGKVDCSLRFQPKDLATGEFELDKGLIDRVLSVVDKVRERATGVSPLRVIDILRWPGVLKTADVDVETLRQAALDLLSAAVQDLVEMRTREGGRMRELIEQRLEAMGEIIAGVRPALSDAREQFRQRLQERLAEIKQELDPARLEQEIVLFAQKTDVAEELDRLQTHVDEIRRVLGKSGQVGRRLDFLMQELNREANTLAAKSADLRVTNAAIELKVLIEQMREQVQNIE